MARAPGSHTAYPGVGVLVLAELRRVAEALCAGAVEAAVARQESQRLALKLIEAHVAPELREDAEAILGELSHQCWSEAGGRYGTTLRAVLGSSRTGAALDRLHEELAIRGPLLVLVKPLDGVLPRPFAGGAGEARADARSAAAVSREEVYASISDGANLDRGYVALVVLATLVASIGLSQNNTAAIIGAMVVAPLLAPNMALALGMVLGDGALTRRALVTNAAGLALGLTSAALLGLVLDPDPTTRELASRTRVGIWDLVLALAAGCAGALSYTTGVPTFLTGVMVAVALLPPAVASGMLLTSGELAGSFSALLLAASNVTALTLAAMLTFLWRGMRPRNWWQVGAARRSARIGVAVYAGVLVALGVLVVVSRRLLAG